MNHFRIFKKRPWHLLLSFLVAAQLSMACHPRSDQSEFMANEIPGGTWCGGIKAVMGYFAKSCDLGQESDGLCLQISKLPKDTSCQIFTALIKESPPFQRVAILKKFDKMQRASMSKDLAFLIPEDVKPRIAQASYVDAYITAVDRIRTLKIPELSTLNNRNINEYYYSHVGLKDGRIAFGMLNKIKVVDFKLRKNIIFENIDGVVIGIFKWKEQYCTVNQIFFEISVKCYSNLDDPNALSLIENHDASFRKHMDFRLDHYVKVLDEKVYLIPKYYLIPEHLYVFDMEKKSVELDSKPDQIKNIKILESYYIKNFKIYKHPLMVSDDPPLESKESAFSVLTSVPILENLYLGTTGKSESIFTLKKDMALVSIEKKENGDLAFLKSSKLNFCGFSKDYVQHSLRKLNGGYIVFETDDNTLKLYDIWAQVSQ